MNNDFAHHLYQTVSNAILPSVHDHPSALIAVGVFAACNVGLWIVTRGKEFVIGTLAAALFLIPLVKI